MRCERFIKIIAVGKLKERSLIQLTDDFQSRLNRYGKCEITVIPDSTVEKEGEAICRELDRERNQVIFVLSEEGREWTTSEFAGTLENIDRKAVFVIGGPFGLSNEVKSRATHLWSLSKLTFTHEMARFLLSEQLYRALNLLNGGSYHHQ